MRRIVLDTNVLVSGAFDDLSASWKIIEACTSGELVAVVSPALQHEYETILERTVNIRGREEQIRAFLQSAELVTPEATPRVVPDDPEDDKIIAAAIAGNAEAVITNDRHLLDLDPYRTIRILRPVAFEHARSEASGGAWDDLARMIGINP